MFVQDSVIDSRVRVLICVAALVGCRSSMPEGSATGGAGGSPAVQARGTGGATTSHGSGGGGGVVSVDARANVGVNDAGPMALTAWESACIGWLRASCAKAAACDIRPGDECGKSDVQLRDVCRQDINKDGCPNPDPDSFDQCRRQDETDSCDMFCAPPRQFCFDFCFFSCLPPPGPELPDGGGGDTPDAADALDVAAGQDAGASSEVPPAETAVEPDAGLEPRIHPCPSCSQDQ